MRMLTSAFMDCWGQDNLEDLLPMAEVGVAGYKCFLGDPTGNIPAPDDGTLLGALTTIASAGLRAGFHAEDSAIMQDRIRGLKAAGRTDAREHLDSRPDVFEVETLTASVRWPDTVAARSMSSICRRLTVWKRCSTGVQIVSTSPAKQGRTTASCPARAMSSSALSSA